MTQYTELRHAGYYDPSTSEADKKKILADVEKAAKQQAAKDAKKS